MGRLVVTVLVVVGIGYGAWSLLFPGEDAPPGRSAPAATGSGGGDAEQGGAAGAPATGEKAAAPAKRVSELLARADAALGHAKAASTRKESLLAKDEARRLLSDALMETPGEAGEALRQRVEGLNEEVLFSEEALEGKSFLHVFQPGDRLWTLCVKTFPKERGVRIEPGFLLWMNGIEDARRIQEGEVLKVPTEELSLRVSKSGRWLRVLLGGVHLKQYAVGIGANDKTPEGTFEIETKIEKPAWYSPDGRKIPFGDPENPLGTRWMGFRRTRGAVGYGIHGTDEPETVGAAVSQGCVRMVNADVEELFRWVPRGTEVVIVR